VGATATIFIFLPQGAINRLQNEFVGPRVSPFGLPASIANTIFMTS
jgi:hypothetical protein